MREITDYEWEIIHYKDNNKKDIFLSLFADCNYICRVREESEIDERIVIIAKHLNTYI